MTCTACTSGKYKSIAGAGVCVSATAGKFAADAGGTATNSAATQATVCPTNTWSNAGAIACQSCGVGYVTTGPGMGAGDSSQKACICDAGYGRFDSSSTCVLCQPGTYKVTSGNVHCTPCDIGKYTNTTNLATYHPSLNECILCDVGYTTVEPTNTDSGTAGANGPNSQQACICDIGYGRTVSGSSSAKSVACVKCSLGKYKLVANDNSCLIAPPPVSFDTSGLQNAPRTEGIPLWFDKIEPAFSSSQEVLVEIKIAFFCGFCGFLALLLIQKMRGQLAFAGAQAAHLSQFSVRIVIAIYCCSEVVLLSWMLTRDNLVGRTSWPRIFTGTKYEVSIIQHIPRPVFSLMFVTVAIGAAYHSIPAIIGITASLLDLAASIVSAVEMRAYLNLVLANLSPLGQGYTQSQIMSYYYRDLLNISLCSFIIFATIHIMILVGYVPGPTDLMPGFADRKGSTDPSGKTLSHREGNGRITYDRINGGDYDRTARMRDARTVQLKRRVLKMQLGDQQPDAIKENRQSAKFDLSSKSTANVGSTSRIHDLLHDTNTADSISQQYWGDGVATDSDSEAESDGDSENDENQPSANDEDPPGKSVKTRTSQNSMKMKKE